MLELTLQVCLEEVAALGENYLLRGGWEETTAAALLEFLHQEVPQLLTYPVVLILPEPTRPGAELADKGLRLFTTTATRLADQGPLASIWLSLPSTPPDKEKGRRSWLNTSLA